MNTFKFSMLALAVSALVACGGGDDGKNGKNGKDGVNGTNGTNGVDGMNGTNGSNGADGKNSLIMQTRLAIGDAACPNGGVKIDSGVDADGNNMLDAAEVTRTEYVCTPARATIDNAEILSSVNNSWFIDGAAQVEKARLNYQLINDARGAAKNIILFVGDGMGISTVTAARILDGQLKGQPGEENQLSFDKFPFTGLSKTYNVDAQTPDSAGTMTAMMSGVKTDAGIIGIDEDVVRGDCASVAGNELVTALELAEIAGKSTGILSTARITHATPAATYAKSADRDWEDVSDMPDAAVMAGCEDIASQLVNFEANLEARYTGLDVDGIEVVMGGGRRHFLPKDAMANSPDAVSAVEGDRTDGRNLVTEWTTAYPAGVYAWDQTTFDAINTESTERIFGLFNESHMQYEQDRGNDIAGEPSLSMMTKKAIGVLDNNPEGFFLMVESGRIDHGHHAGNASAALTDAVEFAKAVQAAVDSTNPEETLIIVTADHSHVFTIAGYPKRGNPILGKVVGIGKDTPALAADGLPYTTLGYTNGLGYRNLGTETDADAGYATSATDPGVAGVKPAQMIALSNTGMNDPVAVTGRVDLSGVDTTTPGFHQEALVPLSSETHAGEDVGVYAKGPGSHLVRGTNEQSYIFHVMDYAGDLVTKADAKLK